MISVKNSLDELNRQAEALEQQRQFVRRCLELWQSSLEAVESYVFPLYPEAAKRATEDWQQVHMCLQVDSPVELLEATPRLVGRVLHNYAQDSRRLQREEVGAVKAILEVMATAASKVRVHTETYGEEFRGVYASLCRLAEVENPDDLRSQLREEAGQLRERVARMVADSEDSLQSMQRELSQFRARLAEAESAAATDALTGLANRRELERQLEERIQQTRPFCVLFFDLDEFKSINDRFGHMCGDQVLRQFSKALSDLVRPGDVVARWGGDEFFVVFDCPMKDALRRSQQISVRVSRRYDLDWNGKRLSIPVAASSGVVEHIFGESAEELFERADRAMYAVKGQRKGSPSKAGTD